jgi:hypothetical protein
MTVDQANDINGLFLMYNDSIKTLNEIIWRQKYDVKFAEKQLAINNNILNENKIVLQNMTNEVAYYKKRMADVEKLEYIDKKTRKRVTWGILGSVAAWAGFVIVLIIKG